MSQNYKESTTNRAASIRRNVGIFLLLTVMPVFAQDLVLAQDLALDDFLPPVQSGSTEVKTEVEEVDDGTLSAQNMQDGLNYAWSDMIEAGDGVREIEVPSGVAVLAVGSADYSTYDNRDATLLSKRAAYTRALAMAQKNLADHFEGFYSRCTSDAESEFTQVVTGMETVANTEEELNEVCDQSTRAILAGFVTYAVADDTEDQIVTISLASSNKTRNAVQRVGGVVIETSEPDAAWKAVIADIEGGFVPPLGARLITNPETGQFIVVGYGSAVIASSDDAKIQRKMGDVARKRAQMRANSALVSFLNGSKTYWSGGFDQRQIESRETFAVPAPEDGEAPVADVQVLDETKTRFLNILESSDAYSIVASGKLPPGVKQKVLTDPNGDWAYAVAVYSASATARAEKQGEENSEAAGKLDEYSSARGKPSAQGEGINAGSRPLKLEGGAVDEGADNPSGPSGQVTNKSEL